MRSSLLTICSLAASVLASPTPNYAVHEKRDALPYGWEKLERLDRRSIMPMRIALKQRNLDRGYGMYLEYIGNKPGPNMGTYRTPQRGFTPRIFQVWATLDARGGG